MMIDEFGMDTVSFPGTLEAKLRAIADAGFGRLAAVFLVLRGDAAGTIRIESIFGPDRELAFEEGVRDEPRAGGNRD